jgi:hypothetical protein
MSIFRTKAATSETPTKSLKVNVNEITIKQESVKLEKLNIINSEISKYEHNYHLLLSRDQLQIFPNRAQNYSNFNDFSERNVDLSVLRKIATTDFLKRLFIN